MFLKVIIPLRLHGELVPELLCLIVTLPPYKFVIERNHYSHQYIGNPTLMNICIVLCWCLRESFKQITIPILFYFVWGGEVMLCKTALVVDTQYLKTHFFAWEGAVLNVWIDTFQRHFYCIISRGVASYYFGTYH